MFLAPDQGLNPQPLHWRVRSLNNWRVSNSSPFLDLNSAFDVVLTCSIESVLGCIFYLCEYLFLLLHLNPQEAVKGDQESNMT